MNATITEFRAKIDHPHDRASELFVTWRDAIVTGDLGAGDRLPTRRELAGRFSTSLPTVQKALDRLTAAGFVVSRGRQGTFVADRLPHLCHFALVNDQPFGGSRYHQALLREVDRIRAAGQYCFTVYTDIDRRAEGAGQARLEADLAARRLAGCIFVSQPMFLGANPVLRAPVPKVALVRDSGPTGIPTVSAGRLDWLHLALDRLRSLGRSRVAWLGGPQSWQGDPQRLPAAADRRGMETRPGWILAADPQYPAWAGHAMHAIFGDQADSRPDALLIADDHLAEAATAAIASLPLSLPRDLDIVCLNNYPLPLTTAVPVCQLGFDIGLTVATALDVLRDQQEGRPVPAASELPPRFI